jgi:hypothetical protein
MSIQFGQFIKRRTGKGLVTCQLRMSMGFKIPTLLARWPREQLTVKKLMVHRHLDDEKFVTRLSGAQYSGSSCKVLLACFPSFLTLKRKVRRGELRRV